MGRIKIAVLGVGNCASSLVQGIEFYKNSPEEKVIGLMHYDVGGYKVGDIEVVAAFDIDKRKVGKPLNEAIFARPNCAKIFCSDIPENGVIVKMGNVLDGVAFHMKDYPQERTFLVAEEPACDAVKELKESGAEVLVNYLPVGSEQAARFYAQACLDVGVALVNCIPVFIASDQNWKTKFVEKGLPIVGDDIKSQVGATITHRVLTKMFDDRGVKLERTYQLNTGGNTDFLNMFEHCRLNSKKISKTEAVQSQLAKPLESQNIHIGPSDYVPWQKDNKVCFIRMEGRGFGDIAMNLELRLSVEDSPNSAGVVIDAIRCCKLALDRGISGPLVSVSAYTMKHPPVQHPDYKAKKMMEEFITGNLQS